MPRRKGRTHARRSTPRALPLLLLLAGCVASSDPDALPLPPAGPAAAPDPLQPGPFAIGVTTVDILDDTRPHPDSGAPRFVRTEVWYPALQAAYAGPFVEYDLPTEADDPHVDLGPDAPPLAELDIGTFTSRGVRDATPDRAHGPFPVVLFSHGSYMGRFQYNSFTGHLASHGYVVAAADHPGCGIWDVIRDGFDEGAVLDSVEDRVLDLGLLRTHLAALAAQDGHRLQDLLDMDRVAVTGHSLGGFNALLAAHRDPALGPVVALAPPLNPFLLSLFDLPLAQVQADRILMLAATADLTVTYLEDYCGYRALGAEEKYLIALEGAGHFSFTGLCAVDYEKMAGVEGGPSIGEDGCGPAQELPFAEAQQLVNHYAAALLNVHLRGSTGSRDFLASRDEAPFGAVEWSAGAVPDWPDGGCP